MDICEQALLFDCEGESLVGIISDGASSGDLGVLVIVGGPQYRVGSHRQFVRLSRFLARNGVPTMRFDYRGMGDASGAQRSFATVTADVLAAVDAFVTAQPAVRRVVLWGLCDGASAACLALPAHPQLAGAILLNPWVHTAAGQASVMLRHYYLRRLFDGRFWRKLLHGDVKLLQSLRSLLKTALGARRRPEPSAARSAVEPDLSVTVADVAISAPSASTIPLTGPAHLADVPELPQRMLAGLLRADKPVTVILSGRDFVAREFEQLCQRDSAWKQWLRSVKVEQLKEANHTFSRIEDAQAVERFTLQWLTENLVVDR